MMHWLAVLATPEAVAQAPTLAVATISCLLSASQWFASNRKGQHRDRAARLIDKEKKEHLERIETKVDNAIDAHQTLSLEIAEVFADHSQRIKDVSAHVIGPDGKNGLRSRVEQLERRVGPPDRRQPELEP